MKKILVVAAHPDDEILGPGGTISRYCAEGIASECVILGEGITSRDGIGKSGAHKALNDLKSDSIKASKVIGYENIQFVGLPDNRMDSVNLIEVIKVVASHIDRVKPDVIYTHHHGDLNIDHRIVFDAVITAARPIERTFVKEIYCFETPSSTEWNFGRSDAAFNPNVFVDIGETLGRKMEAIKCYRSEIRDFPHPRSVYALETIAARWGAVVNRNYAEAFELIRKIT